MTNQEKLDMIEGILDDKHQSNVIRLKAIGMIIHDCHEWLEENYYKGFDDEDN